MRSSSRNGGGPQGPSGSGPSPADAAETLATLVTMIDTARRLAGKLASDDLLTRLHQAFFAQMPEEDRETILQVLEREVQSRLMTRGTSDLGTGYEMRPNPNARLYLRILTAEAPPVMDHEELVVANLRGLRALRHRLGPSHAAWHRALIEAVELLDPSERVVARRVLLECVAALDAADVPAAPEPST